MNKIKKILLTALFIASTVVLSRFLSIQTPIVTVGFSFVPIMLAGILMGWKSCAFVASLSDIIGALLFPIGSYFFGFTITSLLTGITYGLLLHDKNGFKINKKFIIKLIISSLIVTCLYNGILNTIWIKIITKGASKIIIPVRIAKELIMIPIKIITILGITKVFEQKINEMITND